jgi:hypothetical protein
MLTRRRRGSALPVVAFLVAAGAVAAACSDAGSSSTGTTTSPGDDVTNDTRDAEPRAPANPDPGDGAEPLGQPDASYGEGGAGYGDDAPSAYPGVSECSTCSCPATTNYCFGGATPRKTQMVGSRSAPEAAGDAGPPCPVVAAGTLGCNALPAGTTDCASLVATLQSTYACYLVCAYDGTQMTVYCPSP